MAHRFIAAAVALAVSAGTASAQTTVLSWAFSDLDGTYVGNAATGGTFTASWNPTIGTGSSGDITRLAPSVDTALFAQGSASNITFSLTVGVPDLVNGTATGWGSFEFDNGSPATGNRLSGSINGTFTRLTSGPATGVVFTGTVTGVSFLNSNPLAGTTGSFSSDFSQFGPLSGFGILLTIPSLTSNFFESSFGPVSTQANGQLIPSPGSMALLGLGGLLIARRRR
ncbi:hypothetical protein J4558_18185 [Leptolyngbya sp. 15MV]|nr:hypothetical protein J4558_18185 [Leptolyngbya sp. 15MV]